MRTAGGEGGVGGGGARGRAARRTRDALVAAPAGRARALQAGRRGRRLAGRRGDGLAQDRRLVLCALRSRHAHGGAAAPGHGGQGVDAAPGGLGRERARDGRGARAANAARPRLRRSRGGGSVEGARAPEYRGSDSQGRCCQPE